MTVAEFIKELQKYPQDAYIRLPHYPPEKSLSYSPELKFELHDDFSGGYDKFVMIDKKESCW